LQILASKFIIEIAVQGGMYMDSIEFGKYLKGLRESYDISIRELAKLSGVSNSYISQLETGKRGTPKPDILQKLAPHLNVSYEELMQAAGYINTENDNIPVVKVERDIEKKLQETMDYIENQKGLMLSGTPMDDTDRLLLKQAIEMGLRFARENAKRKFTPRKYRKKNE
jgi:transcriptional regulator with XRE-family HTH domain